MLDLPDHQQRPFRGYRDVILCEPSFVVRLDALFEPLSARCGPSPNENRTGRKAGSTWYRVRTLRIRGSEIFNGRGDFAECSDLDVVSHCRRGNGQA